MNAEIPVRKSVTIHEAKTHLSRLVARAEAGEEIVLKRGNKEVALLVPLGVAKPNKRVLGWLSHQVPAGDDIIGKAFWEPLSDEDAGLASETFPNP